MLASPHPAYGCCWAKAGRLGVSSVSIQTAVGSSRRLLRTGRYAAAVETSCRRRDQSRAANYRLLAAAVDWQRLRFRISGSVVIPTAIGRRRCDWFGISCVPVGSQEVVVIKSPLATRRFGRVMVGRVRAAPAVHRFCPRQGGRYCRRTGWKGYGPGSEKPAAANTRGTRVQGGLTVRPQKKDRC